MQNAYGIRIRNYLYRKSYLTSLRLTTCLFVEHIKERFCQQFDKAQEEYMEMKTGVKRIIIKLGKLQFDQYYDCFVSYVIISLSYDFYKKHSIDLIFYTQHSFTFSYILPHSYIILLVQLILKRQIFQFQRYTKFEVFIDKTLWHLYTIKQLDIQIYLYLFIFMKNVKLPSLSNSGQFKGKQQTTQRKSSSSISEKFKQNLSKQTKLVNKNSEIKRKEETPSEFIDQEIIIDYQIQDPKNCNKVQIHNSPDESKKQQFLLNMIKKYDVQQDFQQYFCRSFNSEQYQECIKCVSKKQKQKLAKDIKQFNQSIVVGGNKKQVPKIQNSHLFQNTTISQQQFIKSIMQKFQIDVEDENQLAKYLREQNIQQCTQLANGGHRDAMRKQISAYLQSKKDGPKSPNKINYKQIEIELNQLLIKFEIKEVKAADCIKLIKQDKTDQVILIVKKKKRDQFKIQLQRFVKYYKIPVVHSQGQFLKSNIFGLNSQSQLIQNSNSKIQQNGISLTIKIGDLIKEVKVKNGVQELKNILLTKFGIEEVTEYSLQFDRSKIQNLDQIFIQKGKKQGLLKLIKKIPLKFQFKSKTYSIWVAQSANSQFIKQQISNYLNKNNLFIGDVSSIFIEFCTQKLKIEEQFDNLQKFLEDYRKIEKVIVQTYLQVAVYYSQASATSSSETSTTKIYQVKSLDRIFDLKLIIEKDFIQKQCQLLQIQLEGKRKTIKQSQQNQLIDSFIGNNGSHLQLILSNSYTNQYYGFNFNYPLIFQPFNEFTIQNDKQFAKIIEKCNFSQIDQQKVFFDVFIPFLFSCIKKRFPMQIVIDKIKNLVAKSQLENIWVPLQSQKPRKMNETFLLMYLLRNSDQRLKIQIMDLVKNLMPLPLQINNFQSIYSLNSTLTQNQDIVWILKKGITICSVGLHNQQSKSNQKGKSDLLNKLFFTNFCLSECKHKIIERIPFIAIRVYDDLFPLNIIDLPHNCSESVKKKLIQISDIVLIHSWKDQSETTTFANNLKYKNKTIIITLMRDLKEPSRNGLKILNQANLQQNNILKLQNLSNYQASQGFIDIIRQKINRMLLNKKVQINNLSRVFNFVENQQFEKLFKIVSNFEKNQTNICTFLKHSYLIDKANRTPNQNTILNQLKKKSLNPEILNFLKFINKSSIPQDIILMHFRQKIRSIQNEMVSKYLIIYKIKQKLIKCRQKRQKFSKQIVNADSQLKNLNLIYSQKISILNKSSEEVFKIIDQIAFDFENNVKPQIFSIELFWRQICAFVKLNPTFVVDHKSLFDLITQIKNKQIMNAQSFQIIDGDCLQMPKDIMKKVFASITEKCLVLSIIGPQSSGKSTLLNFLFGCDFATSQGRCTRGVYGTYFRLNDPRVTNFEGIFVIDTEGLFGLTNQADQKYQDRQNFDSKLVLFCLAVSDFVIINVRGNLDSNTQKILRLCHQKLQALELNQNDRPEIAIVLNQNPTSNKQESENQFKKILKTLPFDIAKSLSLAYNVKNYNTFDICLLAENEILTKKIPKTQFHTETTNLLNEITQKMKKKTNATEITGKIDKFYEIWSTILGFPNLSKITTKQYRQLETKIKQWKKQQDQINLQKIKQIICDYKSQNIESNSATSKVQKISLDYIEQFKVKFPNQTTNPQLRLLIQNETKQILIKNNWNFDNLNYQIRKINLQKQVSRESFEGDVIVKDLQRKIIKDQNEGVKVYTLEQKKEIFEQGFNQALQKIKKSMKISEKQKNQLERIKKNYAFLINTTKTTSQYGLAKDDYRITQEQMASKTFEQLKQKFIQQLLHQIKQPQKFIRYNQKLYTNVFKKTSKDAQLVYFDMRKYFHKQNKTKTYYLVFSQLVYNFNFNKFLDKAQQVEKSYQLQSKEKQIVYQIYGEINSYLQYQFRLRINNYDTFFNIYEYQSRFISRLWNWSPKVDLLLQKIQNQHQKQRNYRTQYKNIKSITDYIKLSARDIYQNYTGNTYEYFKPSTQIAKIIRQKIEWSKIKQYVSQRLDQKQKQRNMTKRNRINKKLIDQLNLDLAILNLQLPDDCDVIKSLKGKDFRYPQNKKNAIGEILQWVTLIKQENILPEQRYFAQKLGQLNYFYGKALQQNMKINPQHILKNYFYVASFNYEVMISNEDKFKGYLQSDRSMKDRLKSKPFQQYIFNEIVKQKKTLGLFLTKICEIIKNVFQIWKKKFQSKAIYQVYSLINQQISQFNNDLNQVSHELHQIFVGKINLIAIYLIWKLELDQMKQTQNQPYKKKQKSREVELKRFLLRTSNDINNIVTDQVQEFFDQITKKFQQYINIQKENLYQQKKKKFENQYYRKFVQSQLDIRIFAPDASADIVLQYLQNPYDILLAKYTQNYAQSWNQLKMEFNNNNFIMQLMSELSRILIEMRQSIQNDSITEQKANPNDLFEKVTKDQAKSNDYNEQSEKILYKYFEDKILGKNENIQRVCLDIKLRLIRPLTKGSTTATGLLRQIIKKIDNKNLKMTNLVKFINICLKEFNLQRVKQNLKNICQFSSVEQNNYINKIRVVICKQKCPCCARICGIEGTHSAHKCLYGHQMRALGGNYIESNGKKYAYVVRCEMLKQTDIMQYNGNTYTWTKFKDYWANKPTGGWLYDDINRNQDQSDRNRFQQAWLRVGQLFCKHKNIEYVKPSDAKNQVQQSQKKFTKTHFIFALDQSGSMCGHEWQELKKALSKIVNLIKSDSIEHFISIITFNGEARIIYQRQSPEKVNVESIQISGGSTNFEKPFQKAHEIAKKYIHQQKMKFVFMTDGGSQYPRQSVQLFQNLITNYPSSFKYYGIEFNSNQNVMKLIETALKGKNLMAKNYEQLLEAYKQCIEIIAYKQQS